MQEVFEKIIEKFSNIYRVVENDEDLEWNRAVYKCEEIVKQSVTEYNNGWIPCSERLPNEHKLYDITFRNSAGIHSDSAIYNPHLKRWLWDADETELVENEVLAWAEKREPYQSSGDHKKKTNFDMCCESIQTMAQVIDIIKVGWTKQQIVEWLRSTPDNSKPITNADKIRCMDDEQLAKLLSGTKGGGIVRKQRYLEWLQSEVGSKV